MPSRKSKPSRIPALSPWSNAPGSAESDLPGLAQGLAAQLRAGDRVLLEGPMGAGKTTFARHLLSALGVVQAPEGSPSFAIAHEYESRLGSVVHLDFYRIHSAEEIDDAGIPAYFWERDALVISEWMSLFPEFEQSVLESGVSREGRIWRVELSAVPGNPALRDIKILSSRLV